MEDIIENDPAAIQALMDAVKKGGAVEVFRFARLLGRPESSIKHAWMDGRLPSAPNQSIPIREGLVALVSCGGFRRDKSPIPDFVLTAEAEARKLLGIPPRVSESADGGDAPTAANSEMYTWKLKYLKAQTAAKEATARAKEMENAIATGVYVRADEVELDATETAVRISRALKNIPDRVASMCVGCTAEQIAAIVRSEIIAAIDGLKTSQFIQAKGWWE